MSDMSDLIKRSEALNAINVGKDVGEAWENVAKLSSAQPKRGEWIAEEEYGDLWVCDQCGFASEYKDNFCGFCGAKMDGERSE